MTDDPIKVESIDQANRLLHGDLTPEELDEVRGLNGLPPIAPRTTAANDQLRQMADWLYALRIARDAAKNAYDRAAEDHDRAEAELFDAIENAGLQSIRTPAGLFSLSDLAWPRIEDRERLLAWAEAEHPELLTLNLQRLQTPLREALREGQELPPGLAYSITRKIRLTANKAG